MAEGGFDLMKTLGDAGFQNLLAGIGARLDPSGLGGALGQATVGYNQSRVAAQAADERNRKIDAYNKNMLDIYNRLVGTPDTSIAANTYGAPGSFENQVATSLTTPTTTKVSQPIVTPPGEPGPTKIEAKPDRQIQVTGNPGTQNLSRAGQTIVGTEGGGVEETNPNLGGAEPPADMVIDIEKPSTAQATQPVVPAPIIPTSSTTPSTPAPAVQGFPNRGSQTPFDLRNFIPFSSAQLDQLRRV